MSGATRYGLALAVVTCVTQVLLRPLPTATAGVAAARIVIDERGQPVSLPDPLGKQAVFMGVGSGEYLLCTGRPQDILTSQSEENARIKRSSLLASAFPELRLMRLVLGTAETGTLNLEQLLRERPGVVVTWARLAAGFERVGLAVVGLGPVSSEARFAQNTRLFAAITDQAPKGEAMIARAQAEQAIIKAAIRSAVAHTTKVLWMFRSNPGRWRVAFVFPELVSEAGGENAGAGIPFATLDTERLLALSPEVILLIGGILNANAGVEELLAKPALASIPAVAKRRVYHVPPGLTGFMNDVVERPILAAWLANVLHPEMSTPTARSVARRIYTAELGVAPSDLELDWALGP